MITFITDENIPKSISESLDLITQIGFVNPVKSTVSISQLGRGATDQEIMNYLKSKKDKFVIITNDRDFKKRALLS